MRKISKIEPRIPAIKEKKKVAAYARISMETDRMKHSLSAQISYYSELIQKNPEWEYVGVYADSGISGTGTLKRSKFQELLKDCEDGKIQIILVKSISRFARNTVDLLETVRHLKNLGIEVRFEKENINTLSADGEVMLSILASFAQEESRSISENCKWGIQKKYKNGKPMNSILYGYRLQNGSFVIEETEAKVVRQIFEWFLEGDSCYKISIKLNAANIKSYYGKNWSNGVIRKMLGNEKYTGNSLMQKYYVEDCITHKQKRNDGQLPMYYAENTHPAIITQETYDKAQQEFVTRYGVQIKNGVAESASFLFHDSNYVKPDYPIRKAQWSEKQKKEHAEVYKSRKTMKTWRYDLSLFIKCEVCGENLSGKLRTFADGTKELRWFCHMHSKVEHKKEGPRPMAMQDVVLKEMVAEVIGIKEFDSAIMCEKLSHISVYGEMVTFHFIDGNKETRKYISREREYRRKGNLICKQKE